MNILILLNNMQVGGSQKYVLTLATELVLQGHKVTVMANEGPLGSELQNYGVNFLPITARLTSKKCLIPVLRKLLRVIKKFKIDIINAQQPIPTFLGILTSRLSNTPIVCTVHGFLKGEFSPLFYKKLYFKLPPIIAISEETKQFLMEEYGIENSWIYVIPNGVEIPRLQLQKKSAAELKEIVYLKTTSMYVDVLSIIINSITLVYKNYKKFALNIIGSFNVSEDLLTILNKINREAGRKVIDFLGQVLNVSDEVKNADIGIASGRSAREIMAHGIPVVIVGHFLGKNGGNFGGIPSEENIDELEHFNLTGRNCSVIATPELIANSVIRLLQDDAYRLSAGRFVRSYIEKNCDIKLVAKKIINVYAKILKKNGHSR